MAKKYEPQKQVFERSFEGRLINSRATLHQLPPDKLVNLIVACNVVEALVWREIHKREIAESQLVSTEVS